MKLITFLVFSGIMQIHAAVYSQNTFTMNESRTTVRDMFKKIERSSNYTIFYRQDQVNLDRQVTVFAENGSIETVMKQVLRDQPLSFEVMNNMVIIKPIVAEGAQQGVISGTVTDEKGEPLIGASVLIKGSTTGASTDVQGRFTLKATTSGSVTLVVKYIGFQAKEVTAQPGQASLKIVLAPEASALSEVVVIGYGTVKKRDLTGSVSSVKSEDIVRVPTHNAVEAIQGRVAGADITRSSGDPGAPANIVIRGNKSITSRDKLAQRNGPLYIIDGFQGGDINTINPNDIASIEVLKDASSTAIYGAQGANGVIIVTTKKGTAGKVKVSYSGYYGVSDYRYPASRIGDDYVNLRREAGRAAGIWNSPADDPAVFTEFQGEYDLVQAGKWIDWLSELQRDGMQQNHAVSLTGGSEKTKVFASLGYFKENGMLRNSDYTRYNARFNVDQELAKWAKAGIMSQLTYSKRNQRTNPLGDATSRVPLGDVYDENGLIKLYPIDNDRSKVTPLADEINEYVARNNDLRTNVITNGFIELTPVKGLSIRSNFGANLTFNRQGIYNDKQSLARYTTNSSLASSEQNFNRFINWDNIITYNKLIKDHSLTLTGITSYIQSDADQTFAQGINQLLASQLFYNLGATSGDAGARTIASPYSGWNNLAYAGRLNYSYKGKYLLTVSGRFDGSSRLAEGNKWDFFPSAAVGWNISEEKFMDNIDVVNNLKLRASYGVSGNYAIDVYGTQSFLTYNPRIGFGDVSAPGYQFSGRVGNPNLGWERSSSYNAGLDISLLRDRISATIDVFKTVTKDILLPRQLPISTGVVDVYENIGETQNKAVELTLTSQNIQSKDFKWSSTITFSRNREKISKLTNGKDILSTSGVERNSLLLGHPISSFYTYRKLGIWQESEAAEAASYRFNNTPFKPGDIKLADLNGDHIISASDDMTYIGSTVPKWVAGLQNNFTYKNFDLSVYLFARYGQLIDAEFLGRYNPSGTGNGPASINYWTPENPTNDFPRPYRGAQLTNYAGYQALNFVDGSYFKIRNVSLGYTLPQKLAGKMAVSRLRVYATASNLLTIAKSHLVKDYDPERGGNESSPLSRQFVFGVNLDL